MDQQTITVVITLAVVLAIMGLRLKRGTKVRPLRLRRMWIAPAIIAVVATAAFIVQPPMLSDAPWLLAIFVAGAGLGWWRGKLMRISVNDETQSLNVSASPLALYFIVGLVAIRLLMRTVLLREAQAWHLDIVTVTDAFLLLGAGLVIAQRFEMMLRARRILALHRATSPSPSS